MNQKLKNIKIAILATDGFEQSELALPKKAIEEAGGEVIIVSPSQGKIRGWKAKDWGDEFPVDLDLSEAKAVEFDGLMLPGGVMSPDTLRINPDAINFVKSFLNSDKPIAAICHGPWTLINANGVKGKTLTSYLSIKTDLINAGANWIDKDVVIDDKLITSRKPEDLPAFNAAIIELFSKSRQVAKK
ncbi:MAG: type 1 glutamine amidotransferase [Parachlamydiaceae bacterium]|nr:type 1 glutamine amidotransferase [Parachlamydiaceae bacterium]